MTKLRIRLLRLRMELLLSQILRRSSRGRDAMPQRTKYIELMRRMNALRMRELS